MGSVTFGRRPSRWRAGVVPLVALFSVAVACSSGAESESRVVGSSAGVGAQPSGTKAAASAVARGPEELAAAGYDGGPGAVFVGVSGPAGRSFAAAGLDGDDAAVTPDMAWEGASLSKMVVAASVLQLVDRGDVDLDEPISSYVDFDVADTITVRDVMMHRSGIADMTAQLESCPSESTLDAMRSHAGAATGPGEVDYSNTNFILLGDMVGQLTGHDIGAYAAEHIFEPLQMTDTYWWESQDGPSPYWRMPSSDPGDVSPFSCAALDQTVGTEGLTFVTSPYNSMVRSKSISSLVPTGLTR